MVGVRANLHKDFFTFNILNFATVTPDIVGAVLNLLVFNDRFHKIFEWFTSVLITNSEPREY